MYTVSRKDFVLRTIAQALSNKGTKTHSITTPAGYFYYCILYTNIDIVSHRGRNAKLISKYEMLRIAEIPLHCVIEAYLL